MPSEHPKELKPLAEANAEVRRAKAAAHRRYIDARRNGIACPKCGNEMYDAELPDTQTLRREDVKAVKCTSCGHQDELLIL